MSRGFTIVELMVTLAVAGLFLLSGFQLYQVVELRNAEAREMSEASNLAYSTLRRESVPPTSPLCSAFVSPTIISATSSTTLPQPVKIKFYHCLPFTDANVIKVWVTVEYGKNRGAVTHATYVSR